MLAVWWRGLDCEGDMTVKEPAAGGAGSRRHHRREEYWKRVDALLASSGNLRERQAAYRDWLDRERKRAALAGALCETCAFIRRLPAEHRFGTCRNSAATPPLVKPIESLGTTMQVSIPGVRLLEDGCDHYLPRAEHDPQPEGGTP